MPLARKLIKVFIASPGDLKDERRAAKTLVEEFNAEWSDTFGYLIELVGWEDTVSTSGRPQAIINRELEQCELFVGMLWRRWGTPPDHGGPYTSGFEEEYRTSFERLKRDKKPEISLLFKEIGDDFLKDPGEDLKKVIAFKEEITAAKVILYENFVDLQQFEKRFRRIINKYVRTLMEQEPNAAGKPLIAAEPAPSARASGSNTDDTPLSREGADFVRSFVTRAETLEEDQQLSATEIARFRLSGTLVRSSPNDEIYLGVHDCNLLYAEHENVVFGKQELDGLLRAALEHYSDENVPIWYWLASLDGFNGRILPFNAVLRGSAKRRQNALNVMTAMGMQLMDGEPPRSQFIRWWLAARTPDTVRVAALNYLGECGVADDLPAIRAEWDKGNSQTSGPAAMAIVRIRLRDGREAAVKELFELQPSGVDRRLIDDLFDDPDALDNALLMDGVDQRDVSVRRKVVRILDARNALSVEVADKLLNDEDAEVRYSALQSLITHGRVFSPGEEKAILLKSAARNNPFNLGVSPFAYSTRGDALWERWKVSRTKLLKDGALEEAASTSSMYDRTAWFVLAERNFRKYASQLRASVDNRYRAEVSNQLAGVDQNKGSDPEVEDHLRKKLTTAAVGILSRHGGSADLQRVRTAIKDEAIYFCASAITLLRDHGEWQDIPLIVRLAKFPQLNTGGSLLGAWSDDVDTKVNSAADAMYVLGSKRMRDLVKLDMPLGLLSQLLRRMTLRAFRELDDQTLDFLFVSSHDEIRKTAALLSVKAISKARMKRLLQSYLSRDSNQYYNVVHWLDLGVSAPRNIAGHIATRALSQGKF